MQIPSDRDIIDRHEMPDVLPDQDVGGAAAQNGRWPQLFPPEQRRAFREVRAAFTPCRDSGIEQARRFWRPFEMWPSGVPPGQQLDANRRHDPSTGAACMIPMLRLTSSVR